MNRHEPTPELSVSGRPLPDVSRPVKRVVVGSLGAHTPLI
jgi:hypothetical protein